MFWVEVPPRPKKKRVSSTPVKAEQLAPEGAIRAVTAPAVKEEPDQKTVNALAVIRNVSRCPESFP